MADAELLELKSIIILTGAGISRESGLDTFRDPDGIWAKVRIEDVATPEAFERDPQRVHAFYNARRQQLLSQTVRPNSAHAALAELEQRLESDIPRADGQRSDFLLVTQNIDDLHERAGSRNLLHMHGEILKARCARSGRAYECRRDLDVEERCECCGGRGTLRPHVVWFGETPLEMERIGAALERCALFVAIGTSGQVYPAAGFVEQARRAGARTVELNAEKTDLSERFDEHLIGPATELVPRFVETLLKQ